MASALVTTSNLHRFRQIRGSSSATGFAAEGDNQNPNQGRESKEVLVAFRTRPCLTDEAEEKFKAMEEFVYRGGGRKVKQEDLEVKFCPGLSVRSAEPGVVVAHVPYMKWSGPMITPKTFEADLAFGPEVGNDEVYARTVHATDMLTLVLNGGVGCVLAYGQTGAGKTHTMEAIESRVARDLFPLAEELSKQFLESHSQKSSSLTAAKAVEGEKRNVFEISVSFLESLNKKATDLLDVPEEANEDEDDEYASRKEVPIHENKLGEVRSHLIQPIVHSTEELQTLITRALANRRTTATHRNASSSRSHAVLTLRVKNTLLPYVDEGVLLLVDLAGSERYEDSKAHDKQRMTESRENNKTLMNLKDCVRAKAKAVVEEEGFVHIPFRSNKLTLLLKPIFDLESRQRTKTVIIAHMSPHIQDSAHSVSTLSYAAPFKSSPPKRPTAPLPYDPTDPRTWDHKQSKEWLEKEITKRSTPAPPEGQTTPEDAIPTTQNILDMNKLLPKPMTAKSLSRLYANEWVESCVKARREGTSNTLDVDELRRIATEVYGQFNYLLLTARLKTRNAVIKSRKKLEDVDNIYGDMPAEEIAARDPEGWIAKEAAFSDEDQMLLSELHGEELAKLTMEAVKEHKEAGGEWKTELVVRSKVRVQLLEKYREEINREKTKTGPVIKARKEYEKFEG